MPATLPKPTTDVSPADWVAAGIDSPGHGVVSLVPAGFEAYARVPNGPDALEGEPDPRLLRALCAVLGRHTNTPDRCWFCLWEGFGWIHGAPAAVVFALPDEKGNQQPPYEVPPAFPQEIMNGPRVRLPGRDYILFEGPLEAALGLGAWEERALLAKYPELASVQGAPDYSAPYHPPNMFWPDDRAWCVASEIDLESTYLGGSEALIEALSEDRRVEASRVDPSDPASR